MGGWDGPLAILSGSKLCLVKARLIAAALLVMRPWRLAARLCREFRAAGPHLARPRLRAALRRAGALAAGAGMLVILAFALVTIASPKSALATAANLATTVGAETAATADSQATTGAGEAAATESLPLEPETPTARTSPATGESSEAEGAPETDDAPATGEAPATEEAPATGEAPVTSPATTDAPAAGTSPATGEAPATGDAAKDAPATETLPATGEAPVTPGADDDAVDEGPSYTEEPLSDARPSAGSALADRVTEFTLKWSANKNVGEQYKLDAATNELTLNPKTASNWDSVPPAGTMVFAEISLAVNVEKDNPEQAIPAHGLKVEMPAYLFKTREGVATGATAIGIAAEGQGDAALGYTYDDRGTTAKEDDVVVISNPNPIALSYHWTIEFAYYSAYNSRYNKGITVDFSTPNSIGGSEVESIAGGEGNKGYSRRFSAGLSLSDGEEEYSASTDELGVRYRTNVHASIAKSLETSKRGFVSKTYDETWWTDSGREVPADAGDYVYALWSIDGNAVGSTQDVSLHFEDVPGNGGKVIAWRYNPGGGTPAKMYRAPNSDGSFDLKARFMDAGYQYGGVLVAYPKSILESGSVELVNTAKITAVGADGDTATAESSATYTWDVQPFVYPPGSYDSEKSSYGQWSSGWSSAINRIEGADAGATVPIEFTYFFGSDNVGTDLLFADGVDHVPGNETRSYTVDTADDFVGLDGERLTSADYEITMLGLSSASEQMAVEDKTGATSMKYEQRPVDEWPEVTLWYESSLDGEASHDAATAWKKLGVLKYVSNGAGVKYEFTDALTGETTTSYVFSPKLPEGTVGVRYSYETTSTRTYLSFRVGLKLKATEHVRRLTKDKQSVTLTNINSMSVYDDKGNLANAAPDVSVGAGAFRDQVIARDAAYHTKGVHPMHESAYHQLRRNVPYSNMWKRMTYSGVTADKKGVTVRYAVDECDAMDFAGSLPTFDEAKRYGMEEQREGTFYELLPLGMTYDVGSAHVWPSSSSYDEQSGDGEYPATARTVDNWRNSGRTMLIVSVRVPDGVSNNSSYRSTVMSGFRLQFAGTYSQQSLKDYGPTVSNVAAFMATDSSVKASPDDGGKLTGEDKSLMTDLDGDGNPLGTPENTRYATVSNTLPDIGYTEVATGKLVRASGQSSWVKSTEVRSGGDYSYQLSLRGDENGNPVRNIVMYDNLEQREEPGRERWKGTISSVDLTLARRMGIDPKLYYSTREGLDLAGGDSLANNPDAWTAATSDSFDGVDKSTIRAIAVDLSRSSAPGQDGRYDYQLTDSNSSVRVVVNMTAPSEGVLELEEKGAVALNDAYISSEVRSTGNHWQDSSLITSSTEVAIVADTAPFGFVKRSGSGTGAKALEGATFRLLRWTGGGDVPGDSTIDPDAPGAGWTPVGDDLTSGTDGLVGWDRLESGTYRLVEVAAPAGYARPTGQWAVTVDPSITTTNKVMIEAIAGPDGKLPPAFSTTGTGGSEQLNLPNYEIPILPSSGSGGTRLATTAGLALVCAGAALALRKLRRGMGAR